MGEQSVREAKNQLQLCPELLIRHHQYYLNKFESRCEAYSVT